MRRAGRGVQVCLIRRKDSAIWGIPKGFIDPGHTAGEAALTEAYEEAGLRGQLAGERVGTYHYNKRGAPFTVVVFVMEVLSELPAWEEMWFRERRWCSLKEATSLLSDHPVQPLLKRVRARIGADSRDAAE